ncbi:MAG: 2-oxoacid ferredoxin oxidoreductase [Candidatus Aminicenantes bacterium]|nr:2-oxoacid ferredoxin oxidoreductase [Candidatus Aminicenantes bacterium]
MKTNAYDMDDIDMAWCPGCGNFNILKSLKKALAELSIEPKGLVVVSGIGQAAKIPHYFKTHFFNGLHGRALPPATGIKAVNPQLTVIAESGDGDMYGEGGNHFLHAIRRNPDITNIIHNNMVYGLTKGQASPTSQFGFKTPVQTKGVVLEPFNPLALAVSQNASFAARAFAGDEEETKEIIKKAIQHKGYALVDIFQPCVSFNKVNTFKWFKDNTAYLDDTYDPYDRRAAFEKSLETHPFALGVIYVGPPKNTYEQNIGLYDKDKNPLVFREQKRSQKLQQLIQSF